MKPKENMPNLLPKKRLKNLPKRRRKLLKLKRLPWKLLEIVLKQKCLHQPTKPQLK